MSETSSQTIEQVLFERMGVSVDDALATGTDFVDEKISQASESGVDVDARLSGLGGLLQKLTDPDTVAALGQLLDHLPQLVTFASMASELPNLLATLGDVFDDYQQRCESDGINVEKALTNGLHAVLFLGSKVDEEHLRRIGDLLDSDVLSTHALDVVDNAAKSLNTAQKQPFDAANDRVGMFGLLKALRDPHVQRSLAFAVQFGKCFGANLNKSNS